MRAVGDAVTALPVGKALQRRALSLGVANAFDYAAQFLLPVVLARCLDTTAFGQYRLLWLGVGTVMAVATLAMPASLYYFLPRSDGATKRLYVNQTLLFLMTAGLMAGWAFSSWNPWLPEKMRGLAEHGAVVPAFVLLWVVASLLDLLPTVEERVTWQAKATIGLAALRTLSLSIAAAVTRELGPVLLVLLAFVAFKVVLLLGYVARHHGLRGPILHRGAFANQLNYAAPFGISGALYELRAQVAQWTVAALFSLGMFASFSIAAVLWPLVQLFRQSVNYAFLPSMSRLQAAGEISDMLELNQRANVMVGTLVYPLLAFAFVFSEEIVTTIYTAAYIDAAALMRVYIIGFAALVVETASITFLLRQGQFVMKVNLVALLLSVPLNWFLAQRLGMAGPAVGSVIAIYLDRIVNLWRIAIVTGVQVRQLQDWRALRRLLLFAALAAALAWGTVGRFLGASAPLVRLALGAAVLAGAYGTMQVLSGLGRGWFATARDPQRGV